MPLYEYVCRACGERFERMSGVSRRLESPACAACGSPRTILAMSVPARVGAGSPAPVADCAAEPGSCCGGLCRN